MKKCKICLNNSKTIVDEKTSKIYYKCLECEYIYLDEKFYIDEEKKHYDKHHNNLESLGYVKMFEDLVEEFVKPYANNIKHALDFGCGEGEVLPIVLERNNIKCDRYDLFYFPNKIYKNKNYDLILSTEVIEHLQNPLAILEEILKHIKQNGYLVLMTAFHPKEDKDFFKWWYIRDVTHIGFFTIKTFEQIAKKYNLEILKYNFKNTIIFKKC
jgi:SAM-dependent methyltransferase